VAPFFRNPWPPVDPWGGIGRAWPRRKTSPSSRCSYTTNPDSKHGRYRPNAERQEDLTRLYRTRPDRLGFGRDHSPEAASEPVSEKEAGGVPLGVLGRPLGISAGPEDRIVAMRWAPDGEGDVELVVELEDGDGDGRSRLRLSGWRALPGEVG